MTPPNKPGVMYRSLTGIMIILVMALVSWIGFGALAHVLYNLFMVGWNLLP